MKRIIKVDFHVHSRASRDSLTDGEKLFRRAGELGLGKLILTDHNTISGALELWKAHPDDVIVGEVDKYFLLRIITDDLGQFIECAGGNDHFLVIVVLFEGSFLERHTMSVQ